jgi:hypothetical protein
MVDGPVLVGKPKSAEPKDETDNQAVDSKAQVLPYSYPSLASSRQSDCLTSILGVFSLTVSLPHEPYKIQIMVVPIPQLLFRVH